MAPREARRRAIDALAMVGLERRADHRPEELSGGERQRVTIARSLVNEPAIVWADEPTGDLDAKSAEEILDLLCELRTELRKTIIMVTHDPRAAQRADRILYLDKGQLVKDSPLAMA